MVKVVIDARMVGAVAHGIARYTAQIARALSSRKLTYEPIFLVNENFSVSSFYGFEIHRVPAAFLSPKEWFEIPKALKKISPALYHSTGFSALPYCPVPTVISIHDLNHLRFGNRMQKAYYQWVLKPFAVKSKAVASVSHFSQNEIEAWLGKKVFLTSNAFVESDFSKLSDVDAGQVLDRFGLKPGHYFFSLANAKPHKNLDFLKQAFLASGITKLPLIVSTEGEKSEKVIHTGSTSDIETRALLQMARATFFPSLYEGFGLPPVEAALLGTPLVVSSIAPHREVLAGIAEVRWADPTRLQDWTQAFKAAEMDQLTRPGADSKDVLLKRYSLAQLGEQVDQIYRRVLELKS